MTSTEYYNTNIIHQAFHESQKFITHMDLVPNSRIYTSLLTLQHLNDF